MTFASDIHQFAVSIFQYFFSDWDAVLSFGRSKRWNGGYTLISCPSLRSWAMSISVGSEIDCPTIVVSIFVGPPFLPVYCWPSAIKEFPIRLLFRLFLIFAQFFLLSTQIFTVGWGIVFWQQRSSEIINSHYVGFHFASCCWKINLPLTKRFRDLEHCASIPFLSLLRYGSCPFYVHFCKLKRENHASKLLTVFSASERRGLCPFFHSYHGRIIPSFLAR